MTSDSEGSSTIVGDCLARSALQYAKAGWPIFPCEPKGKKPLTIHGFKDATTDERVVQDWWTRRPDANIGYATGRYVVLDVDGPEGEAALAAFEAQTAKLPQTRAAKTGRGVHLYFSPNGIPIRNSTGKLGPHLDIRAEGGFVILPPSLHANGNLYEWIADVEPAPMPAWVSDLLADPEPAPAADKGAYEKIPEGKRNTYLASLGGAMRRRGASRSAIEAALLQENKLRCDPPLPESEVRSTAQSVNRYKPSVKPGEPTPIPGVLASQVMPESVTWLWSDHIPLGKVTLFDGDPDEGKSTVCLDLAARMTNGWRMPNGSDCGCPPAGAVIVSLEDGIADTIRPRLEAAGAVLEKVRIISTIRGGNGIERTPTLPVDLPYIEAAIQDVKAKLLVLDPLVGMLGAETNSYRDQDIRRVLAQVATLAEKTGIAVICVRHLNKSGGLNAKYRGGGSIGIIGAARAAFLFAEKPGEEGQYIFAPIKGNLWREKPSSLEYSIDDREGQPVITWHGEADDSAVSLLAQPESTEKSNALRDARNFLMALLVDGPVNAEEVFREARRARISERTLYRAKAVLGIVSKKHGFGKGEPWQWGLPNSAKHLDEGCQV